MRLAPYILFSLILLPLSAQAYNADGYMFHDCKAGVSVNSIADCDSGYCDTFSNLKFYQESNNGVGICYDWAQAQSGGPECDPQDYQANNYECPPPCEPPQIEDPETGQCVDPEPDCGPDEYSAAQDHAAQQDQELVRKGLSIPEAGVVVEEGTLETYYCHNQCVIKRTYIGTFHAGLTEYSQHEVTTDTAIQLDCDEMPADVDNRQSKTIMRGGQGEEKDTDNDGQPDHADDDIDGDGIKNSQDTDEDGDGIKDKPDQDDDGIPDWDDDDIDGDGQANSIDNDQDGDGIPNADDPTPQGGALMGVSNNGGMTDDKGEKKGSGKATGCDTPPSSSGDPQLAALHKQVWIIGCEGESLTEEVSDTADDDIISSINSGADQVFDGIESEMITALQDSSGADQFSNMSTVNDVESFYSGLLPAPTSCTQLVMNMPTGVLTIDCQKFDWFKVVFGWALWLYTLYAIFGVAFRKSEA